MNHHILSAMIFLPFLGAVLQAAGLARSAARWAAIGTSMGSALLGVAVLSQVGAAGGSPALADSLPWIGAYAIHYELAVDGLTAPILLLISVVFPVLLVSEWERVRQPRGLYALLLLLQGSLIGATCAQDLFLLFFFWSLSSLPVFFLVGVWGGPNKERAAFRGLVTSSLGNSMVFAAFILIYYSRDPHTFLIRDLLAATGSKTISIAGASMTSQTAAFALVCLGMALRAPVWPLNGWFWHAAREAPPAVFVGLAGVSVPCAVVIFARLSHQLFPAVFESAAPWISATGMICLLVGAVAILSQARLSSLLAHLVVIHLGLSLLGLGSRNPDALVGVVFHQVGIGVAVAALGLLFGSLAQRWKIEEASKDDGGLMDRAPSAAAIMALSIGAFVGIPGLSGFVGESLIVMGSFVVRPATLLVVGLSLLLVTYSLFGVFRRVFLGPPADEAFDEANLPARERGQLVPLVLVMLLLGFYPRPILDLIRPAAAQLLGTSTTPAEAGAPAEPSRPEASPSPSPSAPTATPAAASGKGQ